MSSPSGFVSATGLAAVSGCAAAEARKGLASRDGAACRAQSPLRGCTGGELGVQRGEVGVAKGRTGAAQGGLLGLHTRGYWACIGRQLGCTGEARGCLHSTLIRDTKMMLNTQMCVCVCVEHSAAATCDLQVLLQK